jgi:dTMP kinase
MFVCLEGIDGAGKSTQSRLLLSALQADGIAAELVCDPGTTKLGLAIRQLILDCDDPISPAAQMLLFSSARAELSQYIQQRIAEDVVVICDRWVLSTLVYQTKLNGVDKELVLEVFNKTSCLPDLCILLDIEPSAAETRKAHETRKDRYERSTLAAKHAMRHAYLEFAANVECAHEIKIIDADDAQEAVHSRIKSVFDTTLAVRRQHACNIGKRCRI